MISEQSWLTGNEPQQLLKLLNAPGVSISDRKLRLFSCACCRQVWHTLSDPRNRKAVEQLETFADNLHDWSLLTSARSTLKNVLREKADTRDMGFSTLSKATWDEAQRAARLSSINAVFAVIQYANETLKQQIQSGTWPESVAGMSANDMAHKIEKTMMNVETTAITDQVNRLRDIMGNPFRKISFPKHWKTSTVRNLALSIYENRTPEDMPILGDALEEAGCDEEHILAHCYGDHVHVLGCWVVDLILGKS